VMTNDNGIGIGVLRLRRQSAAALRMTDHSGGKVLLRLIS
jgi:hypothetical protein